MLAVHGVGELKYQNTANSFWRCARSSPESQRSFKLFMFQQKINKDTILHYGSMLLGAAVLSFGLFNVHSQSRITEGGILGLTLFLHHWTGISPASFPFCST